MHSEGADHAVVIGRYEVTVPEVVTGPNVDMLKMLRAELKPFYFFMAARGYKGYCCAAMSLGFSLHEFDMRSQYVLEMLVLWIPSSPGSNHNHAAV